MQSNRLLGRASLLLAFAVGLGGCGTSSSNSGDTADMAVAPDLAPSVTIPFTCNNPGTMIVDGDNANWAVGDKMRDFIVKLPSDTSKPVGVIFQWHGLGDKATNFQNFMLQGGEGPDAHADFPYILVTPESLGLLPFSSPAGIEWDIFDASSTDKNLERQFFESMLGCMNAQFKIDATRIYVVGFSAGAIMTDLLHSSYPGLISATYPASGAFFNDQQESDNVSTGGVITKPTLAWPALSANDNGTILLSHGGAKDTYGIGNIQVISFEQCAGFAKPYLKTSHRTVLDCPHTLGHMPNPNLSPDIVVQFFMSHRAGKPSPYAKDGLPSMLNGICTLQTF